MRWEEGGHLAGTCNGYCGDPLKDSSTLWRRHSPVLWFYTSTQAKVSQIHFFELVWSFNSTCCSPAPSLHPGWQRGSRGGGHSCQRRSLEQKTKTTPLSQTLTLLHNAPKSKRALTRISVTTLNKPPTRALAYPGMTPSMIPAWNQSSMSRRVAGTWLCPARDASRRRGKCDQASQYRTKRLITWQQVER